MNIIASLTKVVKKTGCGMIFNKKRLFVSIFLCVLCLIFSNRIFMPRTHITVSYDVSATSDYTTEIFYSNRGVDVPGGWSSVKHRVTKSDKRVSITLPVAQISKIRIDFGNNPGVLSVSNIVVSGDVNINLDLNNFTTHQINKYDIRGKTVHIYSDQIDPFIVYKSPVKVMRAYHFDFMVFFILACLYFFAWYKLYDSVIRFLRFLDSKHAWLLVLFFAMLCIPVLHISDKTQSDTENRTFASKPTLFINGRINSKYGVEFDNWFNDHFFGRDALIGIHKRLNYMLSHHPHSNNAMLISDGMIFNTSVLRDMGMALSDNDIKKYTENIAKLQSFCRSNGIQLYVMIPPAKEDVFQGMAPGVYVTGDRAKSIQKFQKYVSDNLGVNILYPRDLYLTPSSEQTFFKTDHHWTEYGAFLGYRALIQEMQKTHPKLKSVQEKDFNVFYKNKPRLGNFNGMFDRPFYIGSDCRNLGLDAKTCPLDTQYKYYDIKDTKNFDVQYGPIKMSRITSYKHGYNKKVTLLGNSYGGFLMPFMARTFKNVQMLRVNNEEKGVKNNYDMRRFEKHILDFDTDILLFYLPSSYVYDFDKLYKDK